MRAIQRSAYRRGYRAPDRRQAIAAVAAALVLLVAACTGSGHRPAQVSPAANASVKAKASVKAAADAPQVTITPANGVVAPTRRRASRSP